MAAFVPVARIADSAAVPLAHVAIAVLAVSLFGGQWVAARFVQAQVPPFLVVVLRFAFIAAVMLPFVRRPRAAQWWRVAVISTFVGGFNLALSYVGVGRIDSSTAVIVSQLMAPFTVLLSVVLLKERVGWGTVAGIALAMAGVVVLIGGPGMRPDLLGVVLVALASLSFGTGSALTRKWGPLDPNMLNGWSAAIGLVQIGALTLIFERGQLEALAAADARGWMAIVYICAAGGLLGFALWYWLIARHPTSRLSPFLLLSPLAGMLGGIVLLGEPLTLAKVAGGAIVIAGVALVQLDARLSQRRGGP